MPHFRIDTIDDPRLRPYRDLSHCNPTLIAGRFIAEGELLTRRLLASRYEAESVLLDERFVDRFGSELPDEVPVFLLPPALVEQLVGFPFHRGILACGRRRPVRRLRDFQPPATGTLTVVVCAGVQDPDNVGSILRSCAAFGVDAVIVGKGCPDAFSRRVLRVCMGAVLQLNLFESFDLASDLPWLRETWGLQLVGTVLDESAEPLETITQRPARLALLLGSERTGLDEKLDRLCDRRVTIPMAAGADSLNVSVAAAVFLYHFTRTGGAVTEINRG